MIDIEPILSHYAADCPFVRSNWLGSAGGMSGAQFWQLETPRGRLILRRWPSEHPKAERLRFIHSVLGQAARNGAPFVPVPIETTEGRSFVEHEGHLWELAPRLPGVADYEDSRSDVKLRAAMTALAKFHLATADFELDGWTSAKPQAAPAVTRRLARLRELLVGGGVRELERAVKNGRWPEFEEVAKRFLSALPRTLRPAIGALEPLANSQFDLQPCIRDVWHDHILFTGDEVTGIVDFGAVDVDTPATDIARLLGSLAEEDAEAWQTGIEAYERLRPLSSDELRAIPALDAAGTILAGCNWIRWICIDQRRFGDPAKIAARFRKIAARCEAALEPQRGDMT